LAIVPSFKGWTKPGPIPPGASSPPVIPPGETLDAISGHFRLFQLEDGHRFSTDDILTAWYGTSWVPSARNVLDLGSGLGTVGMIAAWRLPGARFVTVEAQADSVRLARKSARYNGLDDRYAIREGDFRDPSLLGEDERFDLVLGSPPYFPPGTGVPGDISDYARVAAAHLAAGGVFACVFPEVQRARVETAAQAAELVIVRRRPVVFRDGEPPLVTLFAMSRAVDLPEPLRGRTWGEPSLIVRAADGTIHPEYSAVKLAIGFPP
jgi:tRNA1(Val) A37 N6-methylase TrmN6